jgi:hypothetical protein
MKRNLVALAVAALLAGTVATNALAAGQEVATWAATWAVDLASH